MTRHSPRRAARDPGRLLAEFHAGLVEGTGLREPMARLAGLLGAEAVSALRFSPSADDPPEASPATWNLAPDLVRGYLERCWRDDPWLPLGRTIAPGVINLGRLVPPDQVQRSPFWNEFMRPQLPLLHGLALVARRADGLRVSAGFWRRADAPPFGEAEQRLLEQLSGELGQALLLEARLDGLETRGITLESLPHGVLILSPAGAIAYMNAALQRMLAARDGLRLGRDGLCAEEPGSAGEMAALLCAARTGQGLHRLTWAGRNGTPRWLVEALHLPDGGIGPFRGWRGTAVLVSDLQARRAPLAELLVERFGATPAEAALGALLAEGLTLAEAAERRGTVVATARSQLARLLDKTGTRRQAELTALLARLA